MTRPPPGPSLAHIVGLYAFAVASWSIYSAVAACAWALSRGEGSAETTVLVFGAAALGAVVGIVSLLWQMYFLLESDLRRSATLVCVISLAGATIGGLLGPGVLVVLPAANLGACVLAYRRHNIPKWRRRRGLCAACGYDLRDLRTPLCPECGAARW